MVFKISFSKSPEKVVMDKANVYIMDNNDYQNIISFNTIKASMSKITEVGEIGSVYEILDLKNYICLYLCFYCASNIIFFIMDKIKPHT